jgi:hypothetical protein
MHITKEERRHNSEAPTSKEFEEKIKKSVKCQMGESISQIIIADLLVVFTSIHKHLGRKVT